MVAQELRGRGEDSPGNMPWNHTSVKSKTQAHTYKAMHAAWVQTQWFIYIKPMTQNRLLISTQNCPKTSNGRLWGGRERSHIKGINQRHNLGSTWVIFHLKHIAKHLVLKTLVLRRLLLSQLVCSMSLHNGIASTAVHEVLVSASPLSPTCLQSFGCEREL